MSRYEREDRGEADEGDDIRFRYAHLIPLCGSPEGVNSFFINYAEESIHIEKQTASLYLAFGSDEGAKMAATYHSIISTVKLQSRSVWNYLIMENIKRLEYVDIMRGIAITLVVVGHIIQFNGIPMTNPVF